MNSINQLHEEAMNMAENAFLAQQKGDKMAFVQLSKEAFLLEKEAALSLQNKLNGHRISRPRCYPPLRHGRCPARKAGSGRVSFSIARQSRWS